MTGVTNFEPSMGGKWLEILREIAPGINRVAILFNPQTSPVLYFLHPIETSAASIGLRSIAIPVRDAADIEPAIKAFARDSNGGLIALPDTFIVVHRERFIALAARH